MTLDGLVEEALVALGGRRLTCVLSTLESRDARTLRAHTTAGNPWIDKRLNMGHPSRVTNLIRETSKNI